MPKKSLRQLVNDLDRDRARIHPLTQEAILPPRHTGATRRVCGACWHVVDEVAERKAWMARVGCRFDEPLGGGVCFSCLGACCTHKYPGITVCPRCRSALHEVTI